MAAVITTLTQAVAMVAAAFALGWLAGFAVMFVIAQGVRWYRRRRARA